MCHVHGIKLSVNKCVFHTEFRFTLIQKHMCNLLRQVTKSKLASGWVLNHVC